MTIRILDNPCDSFLTALDEEKLLRADADVLEEEARIVDDTSILSSINTLVSERRFPANMSEPDYKVDGTLWFDTSIAKLKVYYNNAWYNICLGGTPEQPDQIVYSNSALLGDDTIIDVVSGDKVGFEFWGMQALYDVNANEQFSVFDTDIAPDATLSKLDLSIQRVGTFTFSVKIYPTILISYGPVYEGDTITGYVKTLLVPDFTSEPLWASGNLNAEEYCENENETYAISLDITNTTLALEGVVEGEGSYVESYFILFEVDGSGTLKLPCVSSPEPDGWDIYAQAWYSLSSLIKYEAKEEITFSYAGSDYDISGAYATIELDDDAGFSHYFWFNVTDGAEAQVDPSLVGTGHIVDILLDDTASQIAVKFAVVVDALSEFSAPIPPSTVVTINNWVDFGTYDNDAFYYTLIVQPKLLTLWEKYIERNRLTL